MDFLIGGLGGETVLDGLFFVHGGGGGGGDGEFGVCGESGFMELRKEMWWSKEDMLGDKKQAPLRGVESQRLCRVITLDLD